MRYRRATEQGGSFFFTVNLLDRSSDLLVAQADRLREVVARVQAAHPFEILAMVVMPEHLHCVWRLPDRDADYSNRWSLIKAGFSRSLPKLEEISLSRVSKRERAIWQRRFWEHQIRDELDLQHHVDYIHYNPVKHGYVADAKMWKYSSIHRHIERGLLPPNWGASISKSDGKLFGE